MGVYRQRKGSGPVAAPCRRSLPNSQNTAWKSYYLDFWSSKALTKLAPGTEEPIPISNFPTHKTLSEMQLRQGICDCMLAQDSGKQSHPESRVILRLEVEDESV